MVVSVSRDSESLSPVPQFQLAKENFPSFLRGIFIPPINGVQPKKRSQEMTVAGTWMGSLLSYPNPVFFRTNFYTLSLLEDCHHTSPFPLPYSCLWLASHATECHVRMSRSLTSLIVPHVCVCSSHKPFKKYIFREISHRTVTRRE